MSELFRRGGWHGHDWVLSFFSLIIRAMVDSEIGNLRSLICEKESRYPLISALISVEILIWCLAFSNHWRLCVDRLKTGSDTPSTKCIHYTRQINQSMLMKASKAEKKIQQTRRTPNWIVRHSTCQILLGDAGTKPNQHLHHDSALSWPYWNLAFPGPELSHGATGHIFISQCGYKYIFP